MRSGFVRVAAAVPVIATANCGANADAVIKLIKEASGKRADIVVFPQLCVTGSSCGSLFLQNVFVSSALSHVIRIAKSVRDGITAVYGAPFLFRGKLYNCAFVASGGKLKGIVPLTSLPGFFSSDFNSTVSVRVGDDDIPFGRDVVFTSDSVPKLCMACSSFSDMMSPASHASSLCLAGVNLMCCLDSSPSASFSDERRDSLVVSESIRLLCTSVYVCSGEGESTTDGVYTGRCIISECGEVLSQTESEEDSVLISETDIDYCIHERLNSNAFRDCCSESPDFVCLDSFNDNFKLSRIYSLSPFIPQDFDENQWCSRIFNRQVLALGERFSYVKARTFVIGLSGGLDSTLALLVAVSACERMSISTQRISCITMPCFGTTSRTKNNACILAQSLGCSLRTINIADSVTKHFSDIGHKTDVYDTAFENAQARERTQVLMDIANQENGIVVGTGDLSELALGWATYNGDHMSMYGVNAGIPKTMVRALVSYYASMTDDSTVRDTLMSVVDTPISPELIPGQETEDLVGPYELHDFFIYHIIRRGSSPSVVYMVACKAFEGRYEKKTIAKWLEIFCRRFFSQQFKRSCMPDGPAVLDISLSPRKGFSIPSDASSTVWLDDIDINCNTEEGP